MHGSPNVRIGLVVSIGGGVTSYEQDVCLGEEMIAIPASETVACISQEYLGIRSEIRKLLMAVLTSLTV